jgi:D-3-phosphoglycerate dehydrogenase
VSPPVVVITDSDLASQGAEEGVLSSAGLAVRRESCQTGADVVAVAADADALIVQWAPITTEVLAQLPRCRMVSRIGIGLDMIDIEAATRLGIAVANTPSYCIEEVSVHAVALILACVRGILVLDRGVRAGGWSGPRDISGAGRPSLTTVAVIGFGRIGSHTASAASALGFTVIVHDPFVPDDVITADGHVPVTFDEALERADVLTLHAPLNAHTRTMIGASEIERMRPGAFVVNTCRGGLIDEQALTAALAAGHLGGAGLDVFEQEPLPAESLLRTMPNVVLTPHTAWYSRAALAELPVDAAQQVVDFLAGRAVSSIVNPDYVRQADGRGDASTSGRALPGQS